LIGEKAMIPRSRLREILFRSFFIQACWNVERMQNVGFAFALLPLLDFLPGDDDCRKAFLTRHTERFQTNPCLVGPILGSVVRQEEKGTFSQGRDHGAVRLKKVLMGPYAALGDPFFWGAWKPFSMTLGVLLIMNGFLWGGIFSLLLYNTLHGWVRCGGFFAGYRDGRGGADFLKKRNLPRWTVHAKSAAAVAAALYGGFLFPVTSTPGEPVLQGWMCLPAFGFVALSHVVIRRGLSTLWVVYGAALAACGLAFFL